MIKKVLAIIGIIFSILIFTFCIIRILGIFPFILTNNVLLCNKEDKEFIRQNSNIQGDFDIVYKTTGHEYVHDIVVKAIIKGWNIFPSIYGEQVVIERSSDIGGNIERYIHENSNVAYAFLVLLIPYVFIIILVWLILVKLLIPIINKN